MLKTLSLSALLLGTSLALSGAQAAVVVPVPADRAVSGIEQVREAGEAPRREDRRQDRRQDRRKASIEQEQTEAAGVILAREGRASGGNRQRRGTTAGLEQDSTQDLSTGIILAREASSGGKRQRQRRSTVGA